MALERAGITLGELARALSGHQAVEVVGADVIVSEVHHDSRDVTPGSLFVAVRGEHADGHRYLDEALAGGAAAVVTEEWPGRDVPHLVVEDTRMALGWLAAEVQRHPDRALEMVGITGTNGKTTVAHMVATMVTGAGREGAVIGTVGSNLIGVSRTSNRTTPEASDLHRMLRELVDHGIITDVAIEVSSHAMELGRVNGVRFDVVAFTNLSQDHLDFHATMDDYYQAKMALFRSEHAPAGVVWVDNPWGARLADETPITTTTVGEAGSADVVVGRPAGGGVGAFTISVAGEVFEARSPLAGDFNIANAALALVCATKVGIPIEDAIARLEATPPIPGRFEPVPNESGLAVFVDYAHTPDAIAQIIAETRRMVTGRVIAVVGAGGDRDRGKRPLMGAAAATADLAIITSDNPRSEDPESIIDQVLSGISEPSAIVREPDRGTAILRAVEAAGADDAVLILGKGHEQGQQFFDRLVPFDDRDAARQALADRSGSS